MSDTQQAGVVDALSDTVEVSALLTHDINHVWHVLTTNEGAAAFLGEGATLGGKGEPWRATDGTHGVPDPRLGSLVQRLDRALGEDGRLL